MDDKGHVLVVDDEKNILSSLKGILSDEGYMVSVAEDGQEAFKIIETTPPNLVLLDIWIPGIDGLKILKTLKKSHSDIEIVMMSGHGSIDTAVKATKLGAFDFIEKPLSLESVLLTVSNAIKQQKENRRSKKSKTFKADKLVGKSTQIQKIKEQIKEATKDNQNILLEGEEGTGKGLIAKIIHEKTFNGCGPFFKISCLNLTTPALKRYLYRKNGSDRDTINYDTFNSSTIFFHKINETSLSIQSEIITFIKKIAKYAVSNKDNFNCKVILSSTAPINNEIAEGRIKKNSLSVINEFAIQTVPLRKRKDDIPVLVKYYLEKFSSELEKKNTKIASSAMATLINYQWPKNVLELKNIIEQLVTISKKQEISGEDISIFIKTKEKNKPVSLVETNEFHSMKEAELSWEKEFIINNLKICEWDISLASKNLRIDSKDLKQKIKFHGIKITKANAPDKPLQRTLKRSVVLCGQGLHSGIKTGLILSPLPLNSGIIFEDISTGEQIPAHISNVESTSFATSLKKNCSRVKTIEHIMAVLHMYRINNLLIKVGDEVPIMDGSAVDFCQLIEDGAVEEQNGFSDDLIITDRIEVSNKEKKQFIVIEPAPVLSVTFTLDYPSPIGKQEYTFTFDNERTFKKNIAPARTFGFLKDYEKLDKLGLASGGRLSNLIILDNEKVLNTSLRFPDEFVRHKILDILGDLYLLGRHIRGKISAARTGHSDNIQLLNKIKKHYNL